MIAARSRRRAGLLAFLVLAVGVLLSLQVRTPERRQLGVLGHLILDLLMPFQEAFAHIADAAAGPWRALNEIGQLRTENAQLRAEVERLRRELAQLGEVSAEVKRLRKLLGFRSSMPHATVTARVVARDPSRWYTTLTIDRGLRDGLRRNDAVVTADGLVGRVLEVYATAARVLLLTDPRSAVGVVVQTSREPGLVEGDGTELLRLRYLSRSAGLREGDLLVSSGLGGVFPRGLMVGTVVSVSRPVGALFQEAVVRPAADLARLEEVLVIVLGGARQ